MVPDYCRIEQVLTKSGFSDAADGMARDGKVGH